MSWDSAPVARSRGGSVQGNDPGGAQLDAKRRFEAAVAEAGAGLADILWRVVCAGEGMREAESASAGRRGRASWCSASRSTGSPTITASLKVTLQARTGASP
jgi:hypothetical protein